MKPFAKMILAAAALLCASAAQAQNTATAEWQAAVQPLEGGSYQVEFTVEVASGMHTYDLDSSVASMRFEFEPEGLELEGEPQLQTPSKRRFDENFSAELGYIEGTARFTQRVRPTGAQGVLRGTVTWIACEGNRCYPPSDWEFAVPVPASGSAAASLAPAPAEPDPDSSAASEAPARSGPSLWGAVLEAVLWGFAALLTPCVFPMVPMTVSFFMKGSGNAARGRLRASLYGLFIVLLYTLPIAAIIFITWAVGGDAVTADIFNWLATHWVPNVLFFVVFMIFAASFFGAFELRMPSALVNRSDRNADRGGLGGIFFMALTLVLVSFSCTGPIVGSVLIKSTSGEFWEPILTMLAFSLAFALPFTLFALFPALLNRMPRSGGWLNSVKVVLGFVEVALGFKFLSVADQTYHWGLLDREVYLAIWIVVFAMLGFYLLGKLRFAHDERVEHVTVTRLGLSIAVFTFVVYMIPGMWGAPLKALSGYLPPMHSQDFVIGQAVSASPAASTTAAEPRRFADLLHLPAGIEGYFDYEEGMAAAVREDKPLFIDFTGAACTNCREMEARVWSDERVRRMLNDDYVLVALTGDDRTRLPESEWVTTPSGKVLKTLGKINTWFVNSRYGVNAMPTYLVLDHRGELLLPPRGYDLDVEAYIAFLDRGVEAFRAGK